MDISNFYQDAPKKKIGLCIFNRATYARCKTLIEELSRYPNIELVVFMSGALLMGEFGNAHSYIEREHKNVRMVRVPVDQMPATHLGMAQGFGALSELLREPISNEHLDALILVADRHETLSPAVLGAYLQIPLIHLQGGEITGCIDDKVRNAITKLADFHFCATSLAKEYLLQMGEESCRVFETGCPSIDLVRINRVKRTYPKEKYILSIFHPETERTELAFEQTKTVMNAVMEYCLEHQHRCYWYYPNPDPGREEIIRYLDEMLEKNSDVFVKAVNQEPEAFLRQLGGARMMVGNSSCGIRECAYIGIPSVNIGERQQLRERAFNVVDVPYDHAKIVQSLRDQHTVGRYPRSQLFGNGYAARAIATYIQRIDFSLKGPLTYPRWPKFREAHFGEDRFYRHNRRRTKPASGRAKRPVKEAEQAVHP